MFKTYKLSRVRFFIFLIVLVTAAEFTLAYKHLQFGFFIDDWIFLSLYKAMPNHAFLEIHKGWKFLGAHTFAHAYYIGILYDFFKFDYASYHILNQILKIISSLSLFPIIFLIFKNKLLAFLSTIIFALHFSPFGALDNASRGEDFIAVIFMNLFFICYLYILLKNITSLKFLIPLTIFLFLTIFLDPTRMFPMIILIPLIEFLHLLLRQSKNFRPSLKRIAVFYTPILFLFIFSPRSVPVMYPLGLLYRLYYGNYQLALVPIAGVGSTYLIREAWWILGNPIYTSFDKYLQFLLRGPIPMFLIFNTILGFSITKNPLKFILRTTILNFLFSFIVFLLAHHWLYISNRSEISPIDPGLYILPSLLGFFILSTAISAFVHWSGHKNKLLLGLFFAPIFSLIFTYATWIFADRDSLFLGVHAYLNIPAIGTAVFLGIFLTLLYQRLSKLKSPLNKITPSLAILSFLLAFGFLSSISIDKYLSYWLKNGLNSTEQKMVMEKFWDEVGWEKKFDNKTNHPLVFLDTREDRLNGMFYDVALIYKISTWLRFRPYNEIRSGEYEGCETFILDNFDLKKHLKVIDGQTYIVREGECHLNLNYKLENFYAFKLKNKDIHPIREQMLKEAGLID